MSDALPALRPDLEFIPVTHEGRRLFLVRDPLGLVREGYALDARLGPLLARLDGTATVKDLQTEWMRQDCSALASTLDMASLVADFDAVFLLDSPTFRQARSRVVAQFAAESARPAFLLGKAYPEEPAALSALLDDILGPPQAPGQTLPRALVAPHIDLEVGRGAYARAYGRLRGGTARRVVVLGVGHGLESGLFCLSGKDFQTPLGVTKADSPACEALRQAGAGVLSTDDFAHRAEHSIEFQLLFLQHLLGPQSFSLVPILCGPARLSLSQYSRPEFLRVAGRFLLALEKVCAEPGTLVVAGVDFSHIGPKFGHECPAASLEVEAMAHDQRLLELCATRDADGFWAESARVQDRFNVCGFSALATLLEVLPQGPGQVLGYDLWREAPTESAVGFGAVVFPAEQGEAQPGKKSTGVESFIMRKVQVEDSDKRMVFGGTPEELRPDMARTGNVVLVGLPGSGRRTLGQSLAQTLGRTFVDLEAQPETAEASALLENLGQEGGRVIRFPADLLRRAGVVEALRQAGVVFYLSADLPLLLSRQFAGASDIPEETRKALGRHLDELEPLAMAALHFILRADEEAGDLVQDALEKIRMAER